MTRVLVVDSDDAGLDFAMRAAACGHEVKFFANSHTKFATGFAPLFQKVDDWRDHMQWAKDGLILPTSNNLYLAELDRFREFGFRNILGPTVASARLEIIRSAGMEAMQSIGQEVPPYQTFDGLPEAAEFARKSDRAWAHKPLGSESDKGLTYVSKSPADLVSWLQRQIKLGKKTKGKVMLQEKVDRMAEIGVSGWMGPNGFLPDKYQIAFEHKPLYPGDIGVNTGEQGTICQYSDNEKLAKDMLLPLEPILQALGHTGDFSVGAMIDKAGNAHFLEFTCRLGYPAFWIQIASHRGDPVAWMKDLVDGKDSLKVTYDAAIGVVLSQPNYPFANSPAKQVEGVTIQGIEDIMPDVHMVQAMRGHGPVMEGGKVTEGDVYQTAGEIVATVTSTGKTVSRAMKKVYSQIDKIHYPGMGYRNDIGSRLEKELPKLHAAGYATDVEF